MKRRLLSLLTALVIITSVMVTEVSADGNPGDWKEILSVNSINPDGSNTFVINGKSGSVTIPLLTRQQVRRVDILVWHTTSDYPVTAVIDNTSLTVTRIDSSLSRIYGLLSSGFRESLTVKFTDNSTNNATWELLSVKVTSLTATDFLANANFFFNSANEMHYSVPGYAEYYGLGTGGNAESQFGIIVNDWKKYDTISVTGSVSYFALNSVRASVGSIGVPYTMSYTCANPSGTTDNYYLWTEMEEYVMDDTIYAGGTTGTVLSNIDYNGKVLFHLTLDVSSLDRRNNDTFVIWFTGLFDDNFYYSVQIVGVTGTVITADTSEVTWWQRFTTFMQSLFPSSSTESEAFENEAEDQAGEMENLNEQLQNVTRPNIEDVETDIEDYVSKQELQATKDGLSSLMNNQLVVSTLMISLTMSLVAYILYGKR